MGLFSKSAPAKKDGLGLITINGNEGVKGGCGNKSANCPCAIGRSKVLLACTAIVCATILAAISIEAQTRREVVILQNNYSNNQYIYCMQSIMSESRQSGKPLTASQAREFCMETDKLAQLKVS